MRSGLEKACFLQAQANESILKRDDFGENMTTNSLSIRISSVLRRPEYLLMIAMGVLMSIGILGPIFVIIYKSFQIPTGLLDSVYSLKNYSRFFTPRVYTGIMNSFIIAFGSSAIGGTLGVILAWINARTNTPLRSVFNVLNIIPYFISTLVGAIAWSLLASPKIGMLNHILMSLFHLQTAPLNIYSIPGIIWVSALFHTPFIYLFCIGPFSQMDPTLEEAARVTGSSWTRTTLKITLPMAAPAIISSFILTFVLAIEDLGSPVVLGYPYGVQTISTLMFDGIDKYPADHNFSAAIGVLMMCFTIFGVMMQRRIMSRRSFATVTGRGYRPTRINLGKWKYLTCGINLLYIALAVVLPIATLVVVSFSRAWLGEINVSAFTTHWYKFIFTQSDITVRGIKNSLFLSTAAATIGVCIATIISYTIHRMKTKFGGWLDFVTTLPIAVSGMVMAIGFLAALIKTPLYGSIYLLLLAYVVRFFTYGQRSISGIMMALSMDVEESSRVCGAGWFKTMRRILLPLVLPGFVAGWLLLFITYMREVSMSLLLSRNGTETLSVALYDLLNYSPYGAMAAFTVVQVIIVLFAAMVFVRFVRSGDNKGIKI